MDAIIDATPSDTPSITIENAETLSTRDLLEQAYDKLEAPEATKPEVVAEPEAAKADPEVKADEPATAEEAKADEPPAEEAKADTSKSEVKAPRMWSPQTRDKFASLPEDVQAEITKREREIDTRLRETAQERQIADVARKTLEPYLDTCRQLGVAPFDAVRNAMEMGTLLERGTPSQKAKLIAQLTTRYKVDIAELENELVANISAPAPSPHVTALEQRLAQLEQQNTQHVQQQTSTQQSQLTSQIEAFVADKKNEFVQDVWQEMTILLNSGKAETLQEAYETACRMNKNVWQTMQSRSQQQANRIAAGTASVKGGAPRTTQNAKPTPKSTRAALEAAWDELAGE